MLGDSQEGAAAAGVAAVCNVGPTRRAAPHCSSPLPACPGARSSCAKGAGCHPLQTSDPVPSPPWDHEPPPTFIPTLPTCRRGRIHKSQRRPVGAVQMLGGGGRGWGAAAWARPAPSGCPRPAAEPSDAGAAQPCFPGPAAAGTAATPRPAPGTRRGRPLALPVSRWRAGPRAGYRVTLCHSPQLFRSLRLWAMVVRGLREARRRHCARSLCPPGRRVPAPGGVRWGSEEVAVALVGRSGEGKGGESG